MISSNKRYLVSVIIPVYNAEKYLQRCIDSILSQTLEGIEIILINDGSTDNSAKILNEYAERYQNIKVIHQKNSGPAVARNVGLENVSGEYIGFIDSDDYIAQNMYEVLYNLANENNIDIVTSDYYNVVNDKKTHLGHYDISKNEVIDKKGIDKILTNANQSRMLWFAWKGIYKTETIKRNKIVYPHLKLGEETVFVLDCLLSSSTMYYIDRPFYYYEQTPDSLTRIKYKQNLLQQLEGLYFAKKSIYQKHNFNKYNDDLNNYTMEHTIPMLISNEFNNNLDYFNSIKVYSSFRKSEMVREAYKNCSIKLIKSKLKYIAWLLKLKLYFLIPIISKIVI